MPDQIGNITVPEVSPSGTFPLKPKWPLAAELPRDQVIHTFYAGNRKREQRFYLGPGPRRWRWTDKVTLSELATLKSFYEIRKGSYQPFTFAAPNADQTTTDRTVQFEGPLAYNLEGNAAARVEIRLREVNTGAGPAYTLNATQLRFPTGGLASGLTAQAQEVIPLVHLRPRKSGYPDNIFLSDRRCTIGAQIYLPRLLTWQGVQQVAVGVPGVSPETDDVTLVFGNADGVMDDLAADVQLDYATVEFSLFHVSSGIKLDVWAGEVVHRGWISTSGPEFTLKCSDKLSSPHLLCPDRIIDRKCPKLFDNAESGCPFSTEGSLDLVHFPSASAASCDRGYETPNGCLAHSMQRRFGGIPFTPQAVRVKDNSTGFFGFFRDIITPTSTIADGAFGRPLPAIYTDVEIPVNGIILAVRDEGDFLEGVAIVGRGPLGAFAADGKKHTLNGALQHTLLQLAGRSGPRLALGTDPAGANDYLSLDQLGDQTNSPQNPPAWRNVFFDGATFRNNFAAGVAFGVIRINDPSGVQPRKLEEQAMLFHIAQGLSGWTWTGPGSRALTPGLVNPVWIAVNEYLRSRGLWNADTATQEAEFDVTAAVASAAICDLSVPKIVGTGNETQFIARGTIAEQSYLREWLDRILANCLGYYRYDFGKLHIAIRVNSSAAAAFTDGNILVDSIDAQPLGPAFNRLTVSFSERATDAITGEVLYQPNTATDQDDEYALELGRGERPLYLQGSMNLSLTDRISQAQRIASTRNREEVGGVNEAERKAARMVRWKSTILGLDTAPGMVVSITHAKFTGEVRIMRQRILPDFSVEYEGRSTTNSMYDLAMGPKPEDVVPDPVDPEFFPLPHQPVWHADVEAPDANDPILDENERTFALQQDYEPQEDGSQRAVFRARAKLPVTAFLPDTQPPQVRTATVAAAGGQLPGDTEYWLAVCTYRDGEGYSPPSNLSRVKTATGGGAHKVTLTDLEWPAGTFDGYVLFVGEGDERTICAQAEVAGALPASIEFGGPWKRSTWNMPSPIPRKAVVKAKEVIHSGPLGMDISEVTAGAIRVNGIAGLGDDWTGRRVSVIADDSDGSAPVWNFTVTGYSDVTGTFSVTPDPVALGVEAGDVLVVRFAADTVGPDSIGDSKLINGLYPNGMIPGAEVGYEIWVLAGTGRGQIRRVLANTDTVYTVEPWDVQPDASSLWIVVVPEWRYRAEKQIPPTKLNNVETEITVQGENLGRRVFVVGLFIEDRRGLETPEHLILPREVWLFGGLGAIVRTERLTFNFEGDLENPDTVPVPGVVTVPPGLIAQPYEVWASIDQPAEGGPGVELDVRWSEDEGATFPNSLFAEPSVLLPSGAKQQLYTELAEDPLLINREFWVRPFVSRIGLSAPGSDLTVIVRYHLRVDPLYGQAEDTGTIAGSASGSVVRSNTQDTGNGVVVVTDRRARGRIPIGVI